MERAPTQAVDVPKLYRIFATLGLQYGPDYRRLARGWTCTDPNVTLALLHECAACSASPPTQRTSMRLCS